MSPDFGTRARHTWGDSLRRDVASTRTPLVARTRWPRREKVPSTRSIMSKRISSLGCLTSGGRQGAPPDARAARICAASVAALEDADILKSSSALLSERGIYASDRSLRHGSASRGGSARTQRNTRLLIMRRCEKKTYVALTLSAQRSARPAQPVSGGTIFSNSQFCVKIGQAPPSSNTSSINA